MITSWEYLLYIYLVCVFKYGNAKPQSLHIIGYRQSRLTNANR